MPNCVVELPNIGAIISYKLRSIDSPIEPAREWRGRVIRAYPKTPYSMACVKVESLEDGHEGLIELVMLSQIVGVSAQADQTQWC